MTRYPRFWWAVAIVSAGIALAFGAPTDDKSSPDQGPTATTTNETKAIVEAPQPVVNPAPKVQAPAKGYDKGPVSWQAVELVRMAQSGVEPGVIKAYAANCQYATPPSADEIIYLRDHGVASDAITAYIDRANQIQSQNAAAVQPAPAPPPQPTSIAPDASVQAPVYSDASALAAPPPDYTYPAPAYTYPETPGYVYTPPPYPGYWGGGFYYGAPVIGFGFYSRGHYDHGGFRGGGYFGGGHVGGFGGGRVGGPVGGGHFGGGHVGGGHSGGGRGGR